MYVVVEGNPSLEVDDPLIISTGLEAMSRAKSREAALSGRRGEICLDREHFFIREVDLPGCHHDDDA